MLQNGEVIWTIEFQNFRDFLAHLKSSEDLNKITLTKMALKQKCLAYLRYSVYDQFSACCIWVDLWVLM